MKSSSSRVSAEVIPPLVGPGAAGRRPPCRRPWRAFAGGAFWPAPRINVLLCHRRGYDLCNAAERVGSLKPNTRSISGRNVLAAARCLDTPETKITKTKIKKDLSGFVTGWNTWLCSLDTHLISASAGQSSASWYLNTFCILLIKILTSNSKFRIMSAWLSSYTFRNSRSTLTHFIFIWYFKDAFYSQLLKLIWKFLHSTIFLVGVVNRASRGDWIGHRSL